MIVEASGTFVAPSTGLVVSTTGGVSTVNENTSSLAMAVEEASVISVA
jgi:hypothetical protein